MLYACVILYGMHVPCNQYLNSEHVQASHIAHVRHVEHMAHVRHLAWIKEQETAVTPVVRYVSPRYTPSRYVPVIHYAPAGDYSCSALESLWVEAGGNPADEVTAASVAMAESGGNPNAISPTNDYGLWQINGSWGVLATLNPFGNARAAVQISDDGSNWSPWTTYTSGAYFGRC